MNLSNQVVSLELAKRLHELGVEQESLFAYLRYDDGHEELLYKKAPKGNDYWTSAFTVAELGEMLPHRLDIKGQTYCLALCKFDEVWEVVYDHHPSDIYHSLDANTEADARAKMLIYLIENKLITV